MWETDGNDPIDAQKHVSPVVEINQTSCDRHEKFTVRLRHAITEKVEKRDNVVDWENNGSQGEPDGDELDDEEVGRGAVVLVAALDVTSDHQNGVGQCTEKVG